MRNRLGTLVSSTVVVHLPGRSLKGVLVGEHRDCLVLRHAVSLGETTAEDRPIAGEVYLPRPLPPGSFLQHPD